MPIGFNILRRGSECDFLLGLDSVCQDLVRDDSEALVLCPTPSLPISVENGEGDRRSGGAGRAAFIFCFGMTISRRALN